MGERGLRGEGCGKKAGGELLRETRMNRGRDFPSFLRESAEREETLRAAKMDAG